VARGTRTPRWVGAIAGTALAALTIVVGVSVDARAEGPGQAVPALRVGDETLPADVLGDQPTISGDGRWVAFESTVPDPSGEGRRSTVFLVDRTNAATIDVSPVPEGLRSGDTVLPALSGDGCTLAVVTELAHDRFRDDDTGLRWDVYRTTLPHCGGQLGEWELVSSRPDGSGLARDDVTRAAPAIDRPGTVIAFTHPATQFEPVDASEAVALTTISVADLTVPVGEPGHITPAPGLPVIAPNTTFLHAGLDQPALSGDGRHLAFRSDATSDQAVAEWGTGPLDGGAATSQVYVWDRNDADPFTAVHLVSTTPDGAPVGDGAAGPVLSHDGSVVVYTSRDQGIAEAEFAECRDQCPAQVYRLERDADGDGLFDEDGDRRTTIVSAWQVDGRLVAGTASSTGPAIDQHGQIVAFVSRAPNFDPLVRPSLAENGRGDIFVADTVTGAFERVRDDEVSTRPLRGRHGNPQLGDTGRDLVFDTAAPDDLIEEERADEGPSRHVVARSTPPALSLADADLGTTLVGLQSDEWYVAVVNDGPSTFRPASVDIGDPHFTINPDGSTCLLDIDVLPGDDCVVKVSFTPTAPVPYAASLTVAEEGFGAVSVSAVVSGAGGEPALRAMPAGADLGTVKVGSSSLPYLFDIANVSAFATTVDNVAITGAHREDFAITRNSCANRPLNPEATCAIGITFTPGAAGRRTALLEVMTPQGQHTAAVLAGVGRFAPSLAVFADEAVAGREVVAIGTGYRPDSTITLSLGDGQEQEVTTDGEGSFMVWVPVPADTPDGAVHLVADSPDGASVSDPVEAVAQPQPMIRMPGFGLG